MKSDEDIKDDVYYCIKASNIMNNVGGSLRKTLRPLHSNDEDVVISVLSNENGQIQLSYVNVNVYVRDIERDGQYEEDTARLRQICKLCIDELESMNGNDYVFHIESQRVFKVEGRNEHCVNNRLLYKTLNE